MLSLLSLALLLSPPARPVEGVVVHIGEGEVVVDLGRARGVRPGATLKILRRLTVNHPITKKKIEDRFPIGEVKATEVGQLLTIIRDPKGLRRPPAMGDFVQLGGGVPHRSTTTAAPSSKPSAEAPAVDPATKALEEALAWTLGRPLDARIARWERYLKRHHGGPHAAAVARELVSLRALLDAARRQPPEAPPEAEITTRFHGPTRAEVGRRVEMALAVLPPEAEARARLLWRRRGAVTWSKVDMRRDGRFYHRARLPEAALASPGVVEYFIEIIHKDAALMNVAGDTERPRLITITPPPPGAEGRGASALKVEARYVDFNTGGEATDRYFQAETTFSYGVNWRSLKAFRVGLGIMDGEGGETDEIDAGGETSKLALNYAFAEGELGLGEWIGVAGRVYTGNHHANAEEISETVAGAEARLRLGAADRTRLVLGGQVVEALGSKAFADMHIAVFPKIPIKASVAVTGLPVNANLGVQLGLQAGYQINERLSLLAESGWNVRTINHHGLTLGAGLGLRW